MRILVVQQHHISPGQPGGSRFQEMARFWIEAGHQVTVIAGSINYATGKRSVEASRLSGSRHREDGVDVWRCYVPESYNSGRLGRMWALAAFAVSGSIAAFRVRRPDVIIASSPPLTAVLPAAVAAWRFKSTPWVFEIRDLWPESAITTGVLGKGGLITRGLYALERFACRSSDAICVLTPAFADDIVHRGLAKRDKTFLIPNGADLDLFIPGPRQNKVRRQHAWDNRTVALYAGAHGKANALGQLVAAAELLKAHDDVLIVTVGDGPERQRWQDEARQRGLKNIQFLGPVPKSEMVDYVNAADIGMAVLQNNPTFRTVYPNKVFDYMSCERPVVLAIDGVARDLVCDQAGAGVFAQPEDAQAIADAILRLRDDGLRRALGANGRRWVVANASRKSLAANYANELTKVAGTSGR